MGVLYILDEPSIGLHPRDNDRLLATLRRLAQLGNTVVVVEHDEDTMRAADHLVDFGPGPGVKGGEVVAQGTIDDLARSRQSLTGAYLAGKKSIAIPRERKVPDGRFLTIKGATHNNLKAIDAAFPLGLFVCVTGVSGSGKSSLVGDILREALARDLNGAITEPGAHDRIEGLEHLDKVIDIDQSPIGRTPRSNPATYIKLFDQIRDLFAQLPEAKARGYTPGRFSFNVAGGRCEACEGNGSNRLEMDFLADVWVTCPVCQGKRFGRETLHVRFKGKSISDVLDMDVQEALEHFANIPKIAAMLQTLHDVGLDYIKLGQPSPTLSGGEAQRIKLARELVKKGTGKTLYILDEPTTGLHFDDVRKLLEVLQGFTAAGNTVVVIEHNLDVVKTADWIIDLGPEGGAGGGRIVAEGSPEAVAEVAESHTGQALRRVLEVADRCARQGRGRTKCRRTGPSTRGRKSSERGLTAIEVRGARQHNLKGIDLDIPRDRDDGLQRAQRLGQELAGDRHALRRGPAAVRREPLELRPAVPGPAAKAQGRADHGPLAGDLHRAEDDQQEPALDGGHGHRDLRLLAHPVRPAGPSVLPEVRRADRHPDRRRDRREGPAPARGNQGLRDGADRAARRRALRGALGRAAGLGLRPGAGRRPVGQPGRAPQAEPPSQAQDRGGRGPGDRAPVDPFPAGRLDRVGARSGQGGRAHRAGRRRGQRAELAGRSLQPAPRLRLAAAAASTSWRLIISRSTARWAGARSARGWASSTGPTRRCSCPTAG